MISKNKRKINFLGIGAPRSGSTWLAQCMYEHPEIAFPNHRSGKKLHHLDKEMNFFSEALFRQSYSQKNRYKKGVDWYLNQFDWKDTGKIRGEFSVGYLADKKAPERIKENFPTVKIIAILRNPVEMVHSAYYHLKALVHTKVPADFDRAVQEKKFKELRAHWGLYAQHLKRYYNLFPRENIHIILLDEVKDNPEKVMQELYSFLDVDENFSPSSLHKKQHAAVKTRCKALKKAGYVFLKFLERLKLKSAHNKVGRNRNLYSIYRKINLLPYQYPPMEQKTERILKDFFREDIEKLEKLIGKDLKIWKHVSAH